MIQLVKLLLRRGFDGEMSSSREHSIKATLRRIQGRLGDFKELGKKYGPEHLEKACTVALKEGNYT